MRRLFPFGLLLLSSVAHAQNPFWQPAGGPPGARIEHVAYDSVRGVTLAASSTTLYRLGASETVWEEVPSIPGEIADLLAHPSGVLFASTYRRQSVPDGPYVREEWGTVWRSEDGGRAWLHTSIVEQEGRFLFAADPGRIFALSSYHTFRSFDDGLSWEEGTPGAVDFLQIDPEGRLFTVFSTGDGAVSEDGGTTWKRLSGPTDTGVTAFSIDPYGHLYFGLIGWGVFPGFGSCDCLDLVVENGILPLHGGPTPSPDHFTYALHVAPDSSTLAGTYGDGLYRTIDRGQSWQRRGLAGRHILALATGPDGLILAGTTEGVFRSTDGGMSWRLMSDGMQALPVTTLLPSSDGSVLAGTPESGLFRLDRSGGWQALPVPNQLIRVLYRGSQDSLFAGTGRGLFRSEDGLIWDTLQFAAPVRRYWDANVRSFVKTPDGRLFATVTTWDDPSIGSVHFSNDRGATWHRIPSPGPMTLPFTASRLITASDGTVFALRDGYGSGLYRYDAADSVWHASLSGAITTVFAHPAVNVLAANHNALLRLDADGTTWHVVSEDIESARALAVNDRGHLFAATPDGVFRSTDAGATWDDVGGGLDGATVHVLALDEAGVLWAGTEDRGVFRSVTPTAREELAPAAPASRVAGFPNPFAGATTIQVALERAGLVRLTVYDVRGRLVATLLDEWRPAGTFDVTFDGRRLAAGVYFYTLDVDGRRITRPIVRAR